MNDRKNTDRKSGFFNPYLLAVAVLAICVVLVAGVIGLLAPAAATSGVSTPSSAASYAGPAGYFPDQFVNQAKEVEPMPEMYY